MKSKKKIIIFLAVVLFLFSHNVFAYDDKTTHPALTDEIVRFHNVSHPENPITVEEKEWIVQGSILEDTWPRWINHFYDPVRKTGWTGAKTGNVPQEVVQALSTAFLSIGGPVSAVEWAKNGLIQDTYSRYGGNYSWKEGLDAYANGDKKKAYETLGHILHLLEDMTVPEHSRDDTHAHSIEKFTGDYGSPFEEYSRKWNRDTIKKLDIAGTLQKENAHSPSFPSIDEYLISTAAYSNEYFFSKDTINDSKYEFPKITREDENFGYGVDENGKEFPLALIDKKWNENKKDYDILYSLSKSEPSYYPILDAYFSRLSRKAVLAGAGVVNLFEKQAAEAVVNKEFPRHLVVIDPKFIKALTIPTFSVAGELYRFGNAIRSVASVITQTARNVFALIINPFKNFFANQPSVPERLSENIPFETGRELQAREPQANVPSAQPPANLSNSITQQLVLSSRENVPANNAPNDFAAENRLSGENNNSRQIFGGGGLSGDSGGRAGGVGIAQNPNSNSNPAVSNSDSNSANQNSTSTQEKTQENSSSTQNFSNSSSSASSASSSVSQIANANNASSSASSTSETASLSASSTASSSISLAITEIMYDAPGADDGHEWIEIFNNGTSSADIAKLKFFESGTNHNLSAAQGANTLAPASYAVLADSSSTFLSDYPSYAGQLFDSSFSLSNTGEKIAVKNGDAVVDEITYSSSAGAGGGGDSLQLIGGIWLAAIPTPGQVNATSSSSSGTAGSTSSSTSNFASSSVSHILISEILFNASGTDVGKEFVELYNPNAAGADISGWSLEYRKENSASTTLLASFKASSHPEDKTVIQAKGFFLIGLDNYDAANYNNKSADAKRTASLPNGEMAGGQPEKIELILYDSSSSEIDKISYDKNSVSNEGQSLERKMFQNGVCASPQGSNEFLGNDCDAGQDGDFEIRNSPNPQNSASLPEPRSAPAVNNFQITYDFAPRFDFSWGLSQDAEGATSTSSGQATSTVSYFIYDTSNPGSTSSLQASSTDLIFQATSTVSTSSPQAASTTFVYLINEVGRDYNFIFAVQDRDGLSSAATSTIAAKSFLDNFYFYRDTRPSSTAYLFDLTATSSRPFWNSNDGSASQSWKAVVFYLNKDAPKQNIISTADALIPADTVFARVKYSTCAGGESSKPELLLPFNNYSCQAGGLMSGAYLFSNLEDQRFTVKLSSSTSDISFSPSDYMTLAFYDFGGGGGGSQRLQLAAVDKIKYYFQNSLAVQAAPTTPGNFSADFDAASGKINLGWSSSTDSDTVDGLIHYEANYSTSTVFDDSAWQSTGNLLYSSAIPVFPNSYIVGVRAVDNFGNISAASVLNWSFPPGFVLLPSQLNHDDDIGRDGSAQKILTGSAVTIGSVGLFVGPDGGQYNSSQSYVEIHRDNGGSIGAFIATSASNTIGQFNGARELVYNFSPGVLLEASSSYWLVLQKGPSGTSNGTRIYGTFSDSYPDGFWSANPGRDGYFRLIQQ